jgi:hypothetical protein
MWNYTRDRLALTSEELAHVSKCKACVALLKLCVVAESPSLIDLDLDTLDTDQEKSA